MEFADDYTFIKPYWNMIEYKSIQNNEQMNERLNDYVIETMLFAGNAY